MSKAIVADLLWLRSWDSPRQTRTRRASIDVREAAEQGDDRAVAREDDA